MIKFAKPEKGSSFAAAIREFIESRVQQIGID